MPISRERWVERFWSRKRVTASGCWIWTGYITPRGYGEVKYEGRKQAVHRVAYALTKGNPDPYVLHTCDRPACFNPDHLWTGTQAENMADMAHKRRGRRSPLESRLPLIQALVAEGVPQRLIAECFGTNQASISAILKSDVPVDRTDRLPPTNVSRKESHEG